jgi:hypothetical protein
MHERDQLRQQIDRLTASQSLRGSESLCRLLHYLAGWAIEHPGEHPKEYQIATEAFGRPTDFDPQVDSTIRVQAGRLRQKLSEYYSGEGADDPIVVELPKGSYALAFHHRATAASPAVNGEGRAAPPSRARGIPLPAFAISAVVIAVVALFAGILISRSEGRHGVQVNAEAQPRTALHELWQAFLADQQDPLVVYSNALFVGRPETGLRYFRPGVDNRNHIFDQYTGIGEVMAVHDLDRLFGNFDRTVVVKRGELFTVDDAQNNNLVFVGSPSENLILREIPGTEDFVFRRITSGPDKNDLAIVNVHPDPGEQTMFLASPSGEPMTHDYAVVALMRGLNPSHRVFILAGTTTFGTQGAVQFVCQEDAVKQMLLRLSVSPSGQLQPFEALLRVKVTNGVPVDEKLIALRERPQ